MLKASLDILAVTGDDPFEGGKGKNMCFGCFAEEAFGSAAGEDDVVRGFITVERDSLAWNLVGQLEGAG
jgi:hypothetical protein